MIEWVHPGLIFILGIIPVFFLRGRYKDVYLLAVPVAAFISVASMDPGVYGVVPFMDFKLTFGRVDRLSLVFGYIFTIMAFIGTLYGIHIKKRREPVVL